MIRQSRAIVLVVCGVLGTGCVSDRALGPDATSPEQTGVFVRVEPAQVALFTFGQKNAVPLTIEAFDGRVALLPGSYSSAYSSSAPEIATVSKDGVVTGVTPGTATITTTVSIGDAAHVVTTPVTVAIPPFDYRRIVGTYDVTAPITIFDPAWGDLTGREYAGVLTLPSGSDVGSFSLTQLDADGGIVWSFGGSITLDVPVASGLFVLRLGSNWVAVIDSVEAPGDNAQSAPLLKGSFGTSGHISGPFVATLRTN